MSTIAATFFIIGGMGVGFAVGVITQYEWSRRVARRKEEEPKFCEDSHCHKEPVYACSSDGRWLCRKHWISSL